MQSVYKMQFFQSSLSLSHLHNSYTTHLAKNLQKCSIGIWSKDQSKKSNNATLPFWEKKKAYKQTKNEEITCSRGILEILSCVPPWEVLADGGSLSKPLACSINAENSSPLPIRKKSFKIYDQNKNYYAYCFSKF